MTISSSTRKAGPFTGNGTATTFPFTFKVFQASDLLVVRLNTSTNVESALVLNTDYTVSLNQNQNTNPGGSIVLGSVLATGFTLTATSDIQNLQPTDLTNQGGFYPTVINDALDRATIQIQQLQEKSDRSLKLPVSSTASPQLPGATANNLLAWNSTGDGLTNIDPTSLATVVAYATAYADVFIGNGITTSWTLTRNPASLYNLDVSIAGSSQEPGRDYTLSGTTFTMTTPPPLGARVVVKYKEGLPNYSGDSQDVRFVPAGSGVVTRSVQSKLRDSVSILDFGADPTGATSSTLAIQAAIASGIKEIVFPDGNYVTAPIFIEGRNYLTFRGIGNPTITFTGGTYGFRFGDTARTNAARVIRLENLSISTSAALATAIDMQFAVDCSFKNIRIQDPSNLITLGLYIAYSWDNTFYDLVIKALNGIQFNDQANKNSIYGGRLESTDSSVGIGILSSFGSANICSGMDVSSWKYGYDIHGCAGLTIVGNYFEGNTTNDIRIVGSAAGILIEGNFFDDRTTAITCIAAGGSGSVGVSIKGNAIYKHASGSGAGIELNATCYNWNIAANLFLNTGPNYVNANLANATFIDGAVNSDGVNVGIGVMPQTGWGQDHKAIDFSGFGSISNYRLGASALTHGWNVYSTDGSTWKYSRSGEKASRFSIDNQMFRWFSAGAGTAGQTVNFGTAKMALNGEIGGFGIGLEPTVNMPGLSVEAGLLTIKQRTTPTADAGYGKLYTKSDNKLYFQDGSGVEHQVAFV